MTVYSPMAMADLTGLGDVELVHLIQQHHCPAAMCVLHLRYHDWSNRLLHCFGVRAGLQIEDIEDFQQEFATQFPRIVAGFDAQRPCPANGGFRRFLFGALQFSFRRLIRRLPTHVHYRSSSSLDERLGSRKRWEDPARQAQDRELRERLQHILEDLSPVFQQIGVYLESGISLRSFARAHDIPYDVAKRRLRKLRALLHCGLSAFRPEFIQEMP